VLSVIAMVTVLLMSGCGSASSTSGPATLKIGYVGSFTGFGSAQHIHIRDGAQLCADWLNEQGGVTIGGQKYKIDLLTDDGQGTVEGYTAATKKLVNEDHVKYLVGGVEPPFLAAINAITEPAKVLHSSLYYCEEGWLGPKSPYSFLVNPATRAGILASMDYWAQAYPNIKNIALITPADGSQDVLSKIVKDEASKYGINVVYTYDFPINLTDWYGPITKVLQSKPAGIFWTNGWASLEGPGVKTIRELGFTGPIVASNYESPTEMLTYAGAAAATNYVGHGWTTDTSESDMPSMMKTIIAYANAKQGSFNQWELWGWNGVWCMVQAMEHANSLDPTKVANSWRNMGSIQTAFGPGKMGGQATYGANQVVEAPVELSALMNGKVQHIKWITPDIP
jgi:branched-chain amino acid transport system substrate-binding protein